MSKILLQQYRPIADSQSVSDWINGKAAEWTFTGWLAGLYWPLVVSEANSISLLIYLARAITDENWPRARQNGPPNYVHIDQVIFPGYDRDSR